MKKVESDTHWLVHKSGSLLSQRLMPHLQLHFRRPPHPLSALEIRLRPFTQTSVYQFIATKERRVRGSLSKKMLLFKISTGKKKKENTCYGPLEKAQVENGNGQSFVMKRRAWESERYRMYTYRYWINTVLQVQLSVGSRLHLVVYICLLAQCSMCVQMCVCPLFEIKCAPSCLVFQEDSVGRRRVSLPK